MRSSEGVYLYRRNNGRYYIGRKVGTKVTWKSTRATTRGEALKVYREELTAENRNIEDVRLSEFSERFLSTLPETRARKTVEIYVRALKGFQRLAGDCRLRQVTGEHWDRFRSDRMKQVAPASVNQELRALRAVMNTAVRWGYLHSNPFARERFAAIPEVLPVYFSREDVLRLLAHVNEPVYRDIFLFAVLTGCRREEIVNLQWNDYDEARGVVTIQSSRGFSTKTKRIRVVPLHPIVIQMLATRRGQENSEYVFTQRGTKLKGNNVSRRLRFHVKGAGLRRGLHFHSLRHGFASWLIQAGESLYTVQKLLGHTSPRMTQVYAHLEGTNLRSSIARLSL